MAYLHTQLMDYDNAQRRRHPAIYGEVRSSPQLGAEGAERTDRIFLKQLVSVAFGSRYIESEQRFNALRDQLTKLRHVGANWDGFDAPPPDADAIAAAESALNILRSLNALPTDVFPSADGGVGICFIQNERYAHIEFENSGGTWVLMYGPEKPTTTWQLRSNDADSFAGAWNEISANLQS